MNSDHYILFPSSSFLEGIARALDIGGTMTMYNGSSSEEEADNRAIKSDWDVVGKDLKDAIESEKQKQELDTAKAQ